MKQQVLTLLIYVTILYSGTVSLQAQSQTSEKEPLFFQTYTIEDGLADNWVRDIEQDEQGFMWFATQSGINRFDGYEFETFKNDPQDSTTLSSNEAYDILIDQENNVWVVTLDGVGRLNKQTQRFELIYTIQTQMVNPLPLLDILLYESADGTIWVGSQDGLARFNPELQAFQSVGADSAAGDVLSNSSVTSITESEDGRLWIGTFGGGINILEPETGKITYMRHDPEDSESLPDDYVLNLFIDSDQVLWVNYDRRENLFAIFTAEEEPGSPSGLWKKDVDGQSMYHYKYQPESRQPLWGRISDFKQTRDGELWFSTLGGFGNSLRKYDESNDSFDTYQYDPNMPGSIPWNFSTSVYEDRFGHLWVGTSRGLAKADRQQLQIKSFTPVPGNQYDLQNNLYGIEEVADDVFWVSRDTGTQLIWNRAENSWRDVEDINVFRLPITHDGGRNGYLLSNNTIERIDLETLEKRAYEINTFDRFEWQIYHFLKVSDDNLLIGTTLGLWRLNPIIGESRKIDLDLPFIEEPSVTYLAKGNENYVWLAIENAQLSSNSSESVLLVGRYYFNDERFEPLETDSDYRRAMGGGTLNDMMVDSRDNLWISKTNGLVKYDTRQDSFRVYDEDDGIQYVVVGALEDNEGIIWVSTEFGISRLDPRTDNIRSFDRDDGLRPARMNRYSLYKRENGELMFGGVGGISYFMPGGVSDSNDPPLIQITNVEAGDAQYDPASETLVSTSPEIDWGSNSITMEYVSINFRNPQETTYRYRLDGFQDEWTDAGARRFAQFSNLPPGDYTLMVSAIDANGIESSQPASFAFSVLPPWYRTWWAYGAYGLMFVIGVFVTDRVQRRKVQQKEREKAREKELEQAREIEKAYKNLEIAHEDLKAAQDQLVQQEKLASLGQLTAGIAHEIKNPLNFVNNFSELSLELVEEVREEVKSQKAKVNRLTEDGRRETENSPFEGGKGDERELDENSESDLILDILDDIEANLKTIHKHGARADGIVKSMLQHSRGGSGEMEPADLNAIIKEYVNLSFHGMRAGKDPINVDIDLQLDDAVGEVPLVAEDFSRVIVNLTNNAFDAMREKAEGKSEKSSIDLQGFQNLGGLDDYQPKLTVRTHKTDGSVTIEIEDNGPGIPDDMKDKVLQPFFTTKKGTDGTGLGLSITNDIIKAHNGNLAVDSSKKGTNFIINLNGTNI